jgi:hypothetical protein
MGDGTPGRNCQIVSSATDSCKHMLKHAGGTLEDYCLAGIASRSHAAWKPDAAESGYHSGEEKDHGHDHAESH